MQERKITSIQDRLKYDESLYLEYGVPLGTIPYKPISEAKVPYFEPEIALEDAYKLVEQQKDLGKPGCFVTRQSEVLDGELKDIIIVWGWQE